ncbi:putative RNA-directed DNA polymerase from transposon X-element [Trichonephila clavipes]|nr:putative RNA-directed DNA polymerase from transposon X-element [Trichonephila clavipes]
MCADKESAKSNDENTVVSSSVLSNQSVNETVYLQTLVLRIEHNGKELKVRTILDSGSQKSYISERVIKVLQLRPKSKQTVVHEAKEHDIELLLGADVIGNILTDNSLKLSSGVTVVQTKLGYTVIGKTNTIHNSLCNNVVSLHCANFTVTDLWNLDAIGITDPTEDAKRKHAHFDFLNQFKENLSVLPDGRQWEDLQIIEEVPKTEVDNFGYYLPHRPVMKQASQTMKIRPVFDASARDKSQPSLNDCLNRGSNLIELIPDIIDRFRRYPIGLSSDIEKAFLQLSIIQEHRDYLRFFLPNVEESKIYRHCRVVFGICSSPHSNSLLV